jgi:hypothetical protein
MADHNLNKLRASTHPDGEPRRGHSYTMKPYEIALTHFIADRIETSGDTTSIDDRHRSHANKPRNDKTLTDRRALENAVFAQAVKLGLSQLARQHNEGVTPDHIDLAGYITEISSDDAITGSLIDPAGGEALIHYQARLRHLSHYFPEELAAVNELIQYTDKRLNSALHSFGVDQRELHNAANQISQNLSRLITAITNHDAESFMSSLRLIGSTLLIRKLITSAEHEEYELLKCKLFSQLTLPDSHS